MNPTDEDDDDDDQDGKRTRQLIYYYPKVCEKRDKSGLAGVVLANGDADLAQKQPNNRDHLKVSPVNCERDKQTDRQTGRHIQTTHAQRTIRCAIEIHTINLTEAKQF